MAKKFTEVEYDKERWDCFEKYDEDYEDYGEMPRRTQIKKPVDKSSEIVTDE